MSEYYKPNRTRNIYDPKSKEAESHLEPSLTKPIWQKA